MRQRIVLLLASAAVGLTVLFCHDTVRGLCTEAAYPFTRAAGWFRGQVGTRLEAAWRGLCDGVTRADADAEIERLRVLLARTEAVHRENADLRRALGWEPPPGLEAVPAHILSHGGGLGVWPRLTLDVGSRDGVAVGDAVVVPEGLVGRVAEGVTANTCTVILLSDPGCYVAAEIPGVAKGIVQGGRGLDVGGPEGPETLYAQNPLRLRFVDRHIALQPRQQLLTEGSGDLFPRGIVIGSVIAMVVPEENAGLIGEAAVAPAVDPTLLRMAFVLRPERREEPPE